jgi:hypothetical protein
MLTMMAVMAIMFSPNSHTHLNHYFRRNLLHNNITEIKTSFERQARKTLSLDEAHATLCLVT